jgi:hypothetical protein
MTMFDDESKGYEEPDYEPGDEPDYAVARLRDRKIDEAKAVILEQYFSVERSVYYARQIEIGLEKQFFHWITKRALNELAAERSIGSSVERLEHHVAHFYYPIRHRYPRRQIREVIGMIAEFSAPVFTRAVGHHGELLVESAFARTGFHILDQKVREVERVPWTQTGHDLDFLIERDGIR